VLVIKI